MKLILFIRTHKLLAFLCLPAILLLLELALFPFAISKTTVKPADDFDLVMTFSDATSMGPALDLALAHHKPLFVSQSPWEVIPFRDRPVGDLKQVYMDLNSATTDQNARHAANIIKKMGYKKVVLDVAWFHIPRALFLSNLYLIGSDAKIIPCVEAPPPPNWWFEPIFYRELYKFWGSLGRVVLALFGFETGPSGPPKKHKA